MNQQSASDAEGDTTLSVAELQAAVRLLADEEESSGRNQLLSELIEDVTLALILTAGPLGLLTIWFNWKLGAALLAIFGVSLIVFERKPLTGFEDATEKLKEVVLKGGNTAERNSISTTASIVLYVLGFGCLGGAAWVLYGVVFAGKVNLGGVLLTIGSSVGFAAVYALSVVYNYRYYARLGRTRGRLDDLLRMAHDQETGMPITSKDFDVLSEARTQAVTREVRDYLSEAPEQRDARYSIAWRQAPLSYVKELSNKEPTEADRLRALIDALEGDPHPHSASPVPSEPTLSHLDSSKHSVAYAVDDALHRIEIIEIVARTDGDADNDR